MTITRYNRFRNAATHLSRYAIPSAIIGFALMAALQIGHGKDALLSELQRSQATEGVSIVSANAESAGVFFFAESKFHQIRILPSGVAGHDARLSEDGEKIAFGLFEKPSDPYQPTILAVAGSDGTNLRKFPTMQQPIMICWSPGKERLALWASRIDSSTASKTSGLWTFQVDTGESDLIDARGSVHCPAWSSDGTRLVYSANGSVRIYDANTKNSRRLADGDNATWSPDGKWISVRRGKTYWLLNPQSGTGKVIFKQKNALTPLWWSPDSRYVAYVSHGGGWLSVAEQADLRVRRIQDGAEEKVHRFPWKGGVLGIQWVRSLPLLARARSAG